MLEKKEHTYTARVLGDRRIWAFSWDQRSGMRDGYAKRKRQAAEVSRMHDVFTSYM